MPITKLCAKFVRSAGCCTGKRKIDYYDETITGFVLECRRSGGKSYYLRYQDPAGRQRQLRIGAANDLSFEQARKQAIRLRSEIVLGGDPAAKKAKTKAIPIYADLASQHLAHAKTYQRSYYSTERIIENHVLPRWEKLRLDEIKQQDVAKWLAEKRQSGLAPASVEKIRSMFSRSFVLAKQWEMFDGNPVVNVPRLKFNNARERYLSAEEAKLLLLACACSPNKQLEPIVHLLLLTGARKSELLKAEWRHIDLDNRMWTLPMTKNGKVRHVPLAHAAVAVIKKLPRHDGCLYLFPNSQTMLPIKDFKTSWQKARKEAGLDDVCVHSLRHTAASWLIANGVDIYTTSKILGHSSVASTTRYAHVENKSLLSAVDAGAAMLSI